jgi:hypothetical protein
LVGDSTASLLAVNLKTLYSYGSSNMITHNKIEANPPSLARAEWVRRSAA